MFYRQRLQRIEAKLDQALVLLTSLITQETRIMATLDDIVADVAAEKTVVDGVVVLLDALAAQLAAAGLDQAKLTQLHNDILAQKQALADAVVRDTPAAPPV